ncbi:MAG: sulfotransferase family protein [Acidimicrobiia bacterium]
MSEERHLPNFLIVGTAKAGTTSLHSYLAQHPEVFMAQKKEPQFFACQEPNYSFAGPGDRGFLDAQVTRDWDSYVGLFDSVTDHPVRGEASTWYLYEPTAPRLIKESLPGVKLLAVLRNPVDRAYSSFAHLRRDGREPLSDFEAALLEEPQRVAAGWNPIWYYRELGFYAEQLARYSALFGADRFRVYLFEDLKEDPLGLCQDVFEWLGVDPEFVPDVSERKNVASMPRIGFLHPGQSSLVQRGLRRVLPQSVRSGLFRLVSPANLKRFPPIPNTVRATLGREYAGDVEATARLIDRDLSSWLDVD